MKIEFRLNKFRDIAKWLDDKLPAPLAFVLKGWLYGLESVWIDAKVSSALEKAIAPHRPTEDPLVAPEYWSEPSEVEGLDIIGYTYNESTRTGPEDQD